MLQGRGPGLGAQPLLLSGHDPDQGREPDRALRRSGDAPRMEEPAYRSRPRARRGRRHPALVPTPRAASGGAGLPITTASATAKAASRAGSNSPTGSASTAIT